MKSECRLHLLLVIDSVLSILHIKIAAGMFFKAIQAVEGNVSCQDFIYCRVRYTANLHCTFYRLQVF